MRSQDQLQRLLRRDLDEAIPLPSGSEWRPQHARARWGSWQFAAAGALGLIFVALVIGGQLATREGRLPPASSPAPTPFVVTVSATIRSAVTGSPIRGAVVAVYYDEPPCCRNARTRTTDVLPMSNTAGVSSFPLANGRYKVYVWVPVNVRPGDEPPAVDAWAPQWWGGSDFQTARTLEVAGVDANIEVSLSPGHVISGRVLARTGLPMATGVDVFVGATTPCCSAPGVALSQSVRVSQWVGSGYSNGLNSGVPPSEATNVGVRPLGPVYFVAEYRIAVGNGTYRVRAASGTLLEPIFRWWSGAEDFANARDIVVQDADVLGIDIVLPVDG